MSSIVIGGGWGGEACPALEDLRLDMMMHEKIPSVTGVAAPWLAWASFKDR